MAVVAGACVVCCLTLIVATGPVVAAASRTRSAGRTLVSAAAAPIPAEG